MLDELEVAVAQVGDVGQIAGEQVVDADDRVAAIEQRFAEVGADEAGGAGDDDACAWFRSDAAGRDRGRG